MSVTLDNDGFAYATNSILVNLSTYDLVLCLIYIGTIILLYVFIISVKDASLDLRKKRLTFEALYSICLGIFGLLDKADYLRLCSSSSGKTKTFIVLINCFICFVIFDTFDYTNKFE